MILWNKICGFTILLLHFSFTSSAQVAPAFKPDSVYTFSHVKSRPSSFNDHFIKTKFPFENIERLNPSISADFATSKYGFFCREELKVEKTTKIPFRFRLGSLEQCNYYEGKR